MPDKELKISDLRIGNHSVRGILKWDVRWDNDPLGRSPLFIANTKKEAERFREGFVLAFNMSKNEKELIRKYADSALKILRNRKSVNKDG